MRNVTLGRSSGRVARRRACLRLSGPNDRRWSAPQSVVLFCSLARRLRDKRHLSAPASSSALLTVVMCVCALRAPSSLRRMLNSVGQLTSLSLIIWALRWTLRKPAWIPALHSPTTLSSIADDATKRKPRAALTARWENPQPYHLLSRAGLIGFC